jgi:agmatinase
MLLYTENVLKFAFSKETTDYPFESADFQKYGILGVPFDGTTSYIPGARFGPRTVREASYNFERYNLKLNKNLSAEIIDLGDLEVVHGNFKKTCYKLKKTLDDVLNMEIIPIIIGGDHSISYCVIKSVGEKIDLEDVTIIHFDAHMDLREEYLGEKYSHATVMRRIFDMNPKEIVQIGIRSAGEEEAKFANKNITTFTADDVHEDQAGILKYLENIHGPIYISLDIDVLDPAYAPSVGTPSSNGLDPKQMEKFVMSFKDKNVIGIDILEVSSTQIGDITALNAAKIIYDFLCIQK